MSRRLIVSSIAAVFIFFALGSLSTYYLPKIEAHIIKEIEKFSEGESPVRIQPEKVHFNWFPVGVALKGVSIQPKKPLNHKLSNTKLQSITANINVFSLFKKKFRISQLILNGAQISYIDKTLRNKESIDYSNFKLTFLKKIPIDDIVLRNINFLARVKEPEFSLKVNNLFFNFTNYGDSADIHVKTDKLQIKESSQSPILDVNFQARLGVEQELIKIKPIKLKNRESHITITGEINGPWLKKKYSKVKLKSNGDLRLNNIKSILEKIFPQKNIPELRGRSKIALSVSHISKQEPEFDFNINTQNMFINGFEIGHLTTQGHYEKESAQLKRFRIKNSSGSASLNNSEIIKSGKNYNFKTKLHVKSFKLKEFLSTLKIKNPTIQILVSGELPCSGRIYPNFNSQCSGELSGENLDLTIKGKNLIKLQAFKAKGRVNVDLKKVSYKADIKLNDSVGQSDGIINYSSGFNINYEGKIKRLEDIDNLFNLDFEGSADIKGSTSGNSRTAVAKMDIKADSLWFEDWALGQSDMKLKYKKGLLSIAYDGLFEQTNYNGNLTINFPDSQIFIQGKVPHASAIDLRDITSRKLTYPIQFTGIGRAQFKVWGPLKISALNLDFNSQFNNGSIASESFDELKANFKAKDGLLDVRQFVIKKSESKINAVGRIYPSGQLDLSIGGSNISLKDSDNFASLGLNMTSQMKFNARIVGFISAPVLSLNSEFTKTLISDIPKEDSYIDLDYSPTELSARFNIINKTILGNFIWPSNTQKNASINLKTQKFDFIDFFSSLAKNSQDHNIDSQVNADIQIQGKRSNLLDSSGHIHINEFKIRKGSLSMQAPLPMKISLNKGKLSTQDFQIHGDGTFISLSSKNSSLDELNLFLNGKANLGLAIFALPIFEDLRGKVSFSTQIKSSLLKPRILGSGYLQQAFLKIYDFPHTFENISSDAIFSENNIVINSFKAQVAGGHATANGKIAIKSYKDIPVNISAQLTDAAINVPDGFITKGKANLQLTGNWIPYKLSGDYIIQKGKVKKSFKETSSVKRVEASSYLPETVIKEHISPLFLDLNIKMNSYLPINLLLDNASVDVQAQGDLKVKGDLLNPKLTGEISTKPGGEIQIRDTNFEIQSGLITYKNTPPESPILQVTAESRVQEYDITLLAQGSAKDPLLLFTSQPELPEHEIISLLIAGYTANDLETQLNAKQQSDQTTFQIGSTLIKQQLGLTKDINKKLGVEFDIGSSYDEDKDATIPSFTLKKQWTPKFGASASRTIEKSAQNNFKLEYKFNSRFSAIGSFQQKDNSDNTIIDNRKQDTLGLDLEYKINFK